MSETASSRIRVPCKYKCLRCGLVYDSTYLPDVMEELSCPECASNSQWRLPEEKKKGKAGAEADSDE